MFTRSFRHWTARYVIDRLRLSLYQRANPESPWLCQEAVRTLDSWLKPTDRGLECGSGRSTLWFASRVAHVITVEHNQEWADTVKKKLRDAGLADRVDYNLFPDGEEEKPDSDYVSVVHGLAPYTLDFCLVDGVSRDHCAMGCLEKLKPGGIVVVDNVERYIPKNPKSRAPESRTPQDGFASQQWEEFARITKNWRCIWTTNGVWDTALWIKAHL